MCEAVHMWLRLCRSSSYVLTASTNIETLLLDTLTCSMQVLVQM